MTLAKPGPRSTARALREEFDLSFALQPPSGGAAREKLLAIRVGNDPFAIRVTDIVGLHADRPVIGLPSPLPELLGMASFRGQIAPVYDLAALLGRTRTTAAPRWMVLLRGRKVADGSEPAAFAFDAFDRHLAVDPGELIHASGVGQDEPARPYLGDAVRAGDTVHPVIQLQAMLSDIEGRMRSIRP
jgi:purine-binding chemotaxis protein CheW